MTMGAGPLRQNPYITDPYGMGLTMSDVAAQPGFVPATMPYGAQFQEYDLYGP